MKISQTHHVTKNNIVKRNSGKKNVWKLINQIDRPEKYFMEWHTLAISKVKNTYRPMTIENGYVWIANAVSHRDGNVFQVRVGKFDKVNNVMPSKDYVFKTKEKALEFATNYMKVH